MTTLEPGASVVFTQGLVASPASTAFLASSAAPTMTDGLEVLVHDVMAAITTEPWATEVCLPSSSAPWAGWDGRPVPEVAGLPAGWSASPFSRSAVNGSDAGKVS